MACVDQITQQNLIDAKTDAITLGEVATSKAGAVSAGAPIASSTNRFGNTTDTLQGRLDKLGVIISDPIDDWTALTSITDMRAHRYPATTGDVYIPVKPLPFTTDATFNIANWVLYSGEVLQERAITKATIAAAKADDSLVGSDYVDIIDNDNGYAINATYKILAGAGAEDNKRIHNSDTLNLFNLELQDDDILNVKLGAVVGDGVTNDTANIELSGYTPTGTYLVDDDHPIDDYFGEGEFKKTTGVFPVAPARDQGQLVTLSEANVTQINPRGWYTDGNYAYVVNQGSYDFSQTSTFDIFDVRDKNRIIRLSSTSVGIVGSNYRPLSVYGNYVYVQGFLFNTLTIFDVSNPHAPIKVKDEVAFETGSREQSLIVGSMLVTALMTGDVMFHSLKDPENPELIARLPVTGIVHRMLLDGNTLWFIVAVPSSTSNLLSVDITDNNNPAIIAYSTIPTLIEARVGAIKGRYLYSGGFNPSTSRLNIIDISDPAAPTAVFVHSTLEAAEVEVVGDLLFIDSEFWDIRDPLLPFNTGVSTDTIQKPIAVGSSILGLTLGTGAAGPAAGDGNANATLRAIRISNYDVRGADIGSVRSERTYTRELTVKGQASAESVNVGAGGIATVGTSAAARQSANGVIDNTKYKVEMFKFLPGDISSNIDIFSIAGLNRHVFCELHYSLINNASDGGASAHTTGVKNFTFYINASSVHTIRIPVGDMVTERTVGVAAVLTVTITNGATSADPITIGVSSPQLGAVGFPRSMFRLNAHFSDFGFKADVL